MNGQLCVEFRKLYPEYNWSDKLKTPKQTQKVLEMVDMRQQETRVVLSATNIQQLLNARIALKFPEKQLQCQTLLQELINE